MINENYIETQSAALNPVALSCMNCILYMQSIVSSIVTPRKELMLGKWVAKVLLVHPVQSTDQEKCS